MLFKISNAFVLVTDKSCHSDLLWCKGSTSLQHTKKNNVVSLHTTLRAPASLQIEAPRYHLTCKGSPVGVHHVPLNLDEGTSLSPSDLPPSPPPPTQIQVGAPGSNNLHYRGPVDCAMKLVKAQGVSSLFRGASVTALRDTPSIGLYFASYEGMKEHLERRWGLGQQASSFCAGGIAGASSWFVIYPLDVVKSIQQVLLLVVVVVAVAAAVDVVVCPVIPRC